MDTYAGYIRSERDNIEAERIAKVSDFPESRAYGRSRELLRMAADQIEVLEQRVEVYRSLVTRERTGADDAIRVAREAVDLAKGLAQ